MKRLSFLLLFPLLLNSCGTSDNPDVQVPIFHYSHTSYTQEGKVSYLANWLSTDSLSYLIENKASFPLFVYAQGCGTCSDFPNIFKAYLRKSNMVFPYTLLSSYDSLTIDKPSLTQSALLFYRDGKLAYQYDSIETEVMTNEEFESLMQRHIIDTEVEILNPSLANIQTAGIFPYYSFSSDLFLTSTKDTLIPSDFERKKEEGMTALIVDESNDFHFSDLYRIFEEQDSVDSLLFLGNTPKDDKLSSLLSFQPTTTYTLAKYQDGALSDMVPVVLDED